MSWQYFHRVDQKLSMARDRLSFQWDRNDTHTSSTMTLSGVRPRDSGLYGCYLTAMKWLYVKAFVIRQYVYVFSGFLINITTVNKFILMIKFLGMENLIIIDNIDGDDSNSPSNSFRYFFTHGAVGIIPCKPTHPDVIITLNRKDFLTVEKRQLVG